MEFKEDNNVEEILKRIPHRPPFLWVDKILAFNGESIQTEKKFPAKLDIFQGHYPGFPLVPGVLICEAIFQSGALLISECIKNKETGDDINKGDKPVLTRILNAKLKRQVLPDDKIIIDVKLSEIIGSAWFLNGKASVREKVAVKVDFGCTFTSLKPEI